MSIKIYWGAMDIFLYILVICMRNRVEILNYTVPASKIYGNLYPKQQVFHLKFGLWCMVYLLCVCSLLISSSPPPLPRNSYTTITVSRCSEDLLYTCVICENMKAVIHIAENVLLCFFTFYVNWHQLICHSTLAFTYFCSGVHALIIRNESCT